LVLEYLILTVATSAMIYSSSFESSVYHWDLRFVLGAVLVSDYSGGHLEVGKLPISHLSLLADVDRPSQLVIHQSGELRGGDGFLSTHADSVRSTSVGCGLEAVGASLEGHGVNVDPL
jgi:hypothetical protein